MAPQTAGGSRGFSTSSVAFQGSSLGKGEPLSAPVEDSVPSVLSSFGEVPGTWVEDFGCVDPSTQPIPKKKTSKSKHSADSFLLDGSKDFFECV